jgi:predicted transcriptional regulator
MTRTTVQVHVGETMEEVGARAVGAWHRMARGEQVDEKHVSFATWETMLRVLSPKRLELLRHVHQNPAPNIRALAQSLHRDDRRVHDEVEARAAAGLLDRDADGVRADYDAFDVRMTVAL